MRQETKLRNWRLLALTAVVGTFAVIRTAILATADDDKSKKKGPIELQMRQKLNAAADVLEGLATEDKDKVKEGAKILTELSKAEVWQVLKDSEYREHTQAFRNAVRRMDEAAGEGKFASAQLEWLDATKRCFDCHNHMRSQKEKAAK